MFTNFREANDVNCAGDEEVSNESPHRVEYMYEIGTTEAKNTLCYACVEYIYSCRQSANISAYTANEY